MRLAIVPFVLGACFTGPVAPATPIAGPTPVFERAVFGGHKGTSATMLDMTMTRDGRVVALACVSSPSRAGLTVLRFDVNGRVDARRDLTDDSCGVGRIAATSTDDLIVAEERCRSEAMADGCVTLRAVDATLGRVMWTVKPGFSHMMELALKADDTIAIGGWRGTSNGVQDPVHTDVVLFDKAGARLRAIEMVSRRTDISGLAFAGDDLLILALVDGGTDFVLDGARTPLGRDSMVFTRVGTKPWTYVFGDAEFISYHPPKLGTPLGDTAIVVGTITNDTRFVMRFDLADGRVVTRANAHVAFDSGPEDPIVMPDGSIVIAQQVTKEASERGPLCRGEKACRYSDGPEAYGKTKMPSVIRLDKTTLEPTGAMAMTGHAYVTNQKLLYSATTKTLIVGGSFTGSLQLSGGVATTEANAENPCDHEDDDSRRRSRASRDGFGFAPREPRCMVRVSYMPAIFASRVTVP